MKHRFILIGFNRYNNNSLLVKARYIVTSLTGNTHFTTPIPTLAAVTTAADSFEAALLLDDSTEAALVRKAARAELVALLKQLGLYVQLTANGDAVVMGTSGFDLNKIYSKVGVLPAPAFLSVFPQKGRAKLRTPKIYGAYSYWFEYTTVVDGVAQDAWVTCISSKAETVIPDLEKAKEYAFRVCGVGADPLRTYSEVVTSVIL